MNNQGCAVILAGGTGSRLKPYTTILPKPLMPVGNVPILEIVIRQLRNCGFGRIIMAVGYRDGLLRSYFGDGSAYGIAITYSKEHQPLGTVGPLHLVADQVPDSFLFMNGDLLTDIDYRAFIEAHEDSGKLLTLGVFERHHRVADGVVEFESGGQVTRFSEKPTIDMWVSMGVYAMNRRVLDLIPRDEPYSMDELVLSMLDTGTPVGTYRHDRDWYDIGCPEDLERANSVFAADPTRFLRSAAIGKELPALSPG